MNTTFRLRLVLALAAAALLLSCSHRHYSPAPAGDATAQTFMERAELFHGYYILEEVVVLSRHNIRSPLSGKGSVLSRITPHEWFEWTSAPGELSRKGAILETQMGQFFRQWLISEGLMEENERPTEGQVRFYANSLQRTIATAQYFSSGMLPIANVTVERHCPLGTMDPTFHPQITRDDAGWRSRVIGQMGAMNDGRVETIGAPMARNFAVLERVLDIKDSPAARNDTTAIPLDDLAVQLVPFREPTMTGGLKMANSAADALVLQYYEEPDLQRAAFGHKLSREEWESIAAIKDWYGDVLFTTPAVAANVARPLLETILSELNKDGRKFSFLCGHDSNIGSVLAALGNEDYEAPQAIERKTPIGSKLVFCKWSDRDGRLYVDIHLVYASDTQLREMPMLSLEAPPVSFQIFLKGLTPNAYGLYPLSDLEQRLQEAIAAEPPTAAVPANKAEKVAAALHDPASKYVVVVSHRGDWRNYPENSIPAIESVIRMGVDVMELDLKLTKDSVLVLSHDKTLDRTTTGKGPISNYTYEELMAFDLKRAHGIAIPGLKIPTLRQALEVCKDRIVVNVDQGYEYYDRVLALTEELGVTDQILIKGRRPVEEVRAKLSEHPHNMMYMPIAGVGSAKDMAVFDGYIQAKPAQLAYEICFGTLDDAVRATAKAVLDSGSKLWVNTIWASLCGGYDDDAAYDAADPDAIYGPILDLGTSIIQTDRPEFLIRYLEGKGRRD